MAVMGMLVFVFMIAHFIAAPALIDAVNRVKRGGVFSFGDSFSTGVNFFLRFIGLGFLVFFAAIITIGGLVAVVVVMFKVATALGVISLLFAIPLLFVLIFLITMLSELAERAMVVRGIGIGDGLEESILLLRRNFSSAIAMFFIGIGISIALGIGTMVIWAMFSIPFAALGFAVGMGTGPSIVIGLLMGLPVSLVVGGYVGTVQ